MSNNRRAWTARERDLVISLADALPAREIARQLGRSESAVRSVLKRFGATSQRPATHFAQAEAELRRLHGLGYSDYDIAAMLPASRDSVRRWRTALGLPATTTPGSPSKRTAEKLARKAEKQRVPKKRRQSRKREDRSVLHSAGDNGVTLVYGPDEAEFLTAISRWRGQHGRPPSLAEGFRIALSLGWTPPASPIPQEE